MVLVDICESDIIVQITTTNISNWKKINCENFWALASLSTKNGKTLPYYPDLSSFVL